MNKTEEKQALVGTLQKFQAGFTIDKAASQELGEGEFVAVISTGTLDRHGEHVDPKGGKIPKRTIRMYFNHITWGEVLPIGTWLKIWLDGDKWMGHGKIDLADDFEKKIYSKVKTGTLDSISIGFIPKMYDVDTDTWTEWELSEASIVNEPANQEALITSKSKEAHKEIEKALKEKLEHTASKDGADLTELKAALEALNSRLGALEEAKAAANENPAKKNVETVRVVLKSVGQAVDDANRITKLTLKDT